MSLTLVPLLNPPPRRPKPSPPSRTAPPHAEDGGAIAGIAEDVVDEVVHAVGVVAVEPRGADTRMKMVCSRQSHS